MIIPSKTPGGIPFEELAGSPTIRINEKGCEGTRVFRTPWETWRDFVKEIVGYSDLIGYVASMATPLSFPGFGNMLVDTIDVVPFEDSAPDGGYVDLYYYTNSYNGAPVEPYGGGAKVTVKYKTKDDSDNNDKNDKPEVPEGTTLSISGDFGAEYQTIPGRIWTWPDTKPLPADQNPGILIPTITWNMSWERVPLPPWTAIRSSLGTTNQSTFYGVAADHMLFLGGDIERQFSMQTNFALYKLTYKFAERHLQGYAPNGAGGFTQRDAGWNEYIRFNPAVKTNPITVEHIFDGNTKPPYQSTNFANLFKFGT